MDVYAPLAHRFGIARIKWELEDRAFKVLHPERYFAIESGINQSRAERERHLEEVRRAAARRRCARRASRRRSPAGRSTSFPSTARCWPRRSGSIASTTCWRCGSWSGPRPTATTRSASSTACTRRCTTGSRTTSRCPSPTCTSRCTRRCGRRAASTSRSRSGRRTCTSAARSASPPTGATRRATRDATDFSQLVMWLRQIMEWQQDVTDPREFMESLRIDLFQDEVFVFSPKGDLFQLPRGATVLDFAFQRALRGRPALRAREGERSHRQPASTSSRTATRWRSSPGRRRGPRAPG